MSRLALLAAVAAALFLPQTALADAEFADPAGDGGGAPDITEVLVANDSSELIAFLVEVPSHATLDPTSEIELVIDSDRSTATGSGGWDHLFYINSGGWNLLLWDGAQWVENPTEAVDAVYSDGLLLVIIGRSALGDTRAFDFALGGYRVENDAVTASDLAPDQSFWAYTVVAKTFGIAAGPLVRAPNVARAGKAFAVGFLVARTDWPFPADEAAVVCNATLGGKKIAARQAFVAGVASCRVALPKNAKGKKLKIVIRVLSGGRSVTRTYTTTVK